MLISPAEISAFFQVIAIDLALAADNAIVIGLAAAGLPPHQRRRAIVVGIMAAAGLRIVFASVTVAMLSVVGLLFAGGLLLLWVCWKMWWELRTSPRRKEAAEEALENVDLNVDGAIAGGAPRKTLWQAAVQIIVADVSMSLDNVLAVAGAAREHPWVLVFGLVLSIGLVGLAATLVARLFHRYHWIAYVGLAVILYVALRMMWDGTHEIASFVQARSA